MSKWITFIPMEQPPDRKTKAWGVVANEGGHSLGDIRWYAPWRQYTFQPLGATVFERQCLRDLADFCDRETTVHFQRSRAAKAERRLRPNSSLVTGHLSLS